MTSICGIIDFTVLSGVLDETYIYAGGLRYIYLLDKYTVNHLRYGDHVLQSGPLIGTDGQAVGVFYLNPSNGLIGFGGAERGKLGSGVPVSVGFVTAADDGD